MAENAIENHAGVVTFSGPKGVQVYQATTLAHALKLWAKTRMWPSRGWTLASAYRTAGSILGTAPKWAKSEAGAIQCAEALLAWAHGTAAAIHTVNAMEEQARR